MYTQLPSPIDHLLYAENNTTKRTVYPTKITEIIIKNTTQTILSSNTNLPKHPKFISLFGIYGENHLQK